MIRASIDIGSNSVLLLAAELDNKTSAIKKELLNLSFITSLGKDLDKTHEFHPDSMAATFSALSVYKEQLEKIGLNAGSTLVTATEASRVARNASEFYKKVKDELGFSVTLISALGEAHYTALGVVSGAGDNAENAIIMDIGGASTELIKISTSPFKIESTVSLPVGSVRATDWTREASFDSKMREILSQDLSSYQTRTLVCVAGSMTSLAAMYLGLREYDDNKIDGMMISFDSFKKFTQDLQNTSVENLLLLFPHLGKRAPMIAAGAKVAVMIGEQIKVEEIKISTRGLRYGTLIKGVIDGQFTIGKIN